MSCPRTSSRKTRRSSSWRWRAVRSTRSCSGSAGRRRRTRAPPMFEQTRLSPRARDLFANLDELVREGWLRASGETGIDIVDPSLGEVVGTVPASTTDDVERAVGAARRAFDSGGWSGLSARERSAGIRRLVEVLTSYRDEFAQIGTLEVG